MHLSQQAIPIVFSLCLISGTFVCGQTPAQQQTLQSLGNFGIALTNVVSTASQQGLVQYQTGGDPQATAKNVQTIQQSYILSRNMNRGVTALLGADAEVVYTGIDVETAGASLVATLPLRWATNKGLESLGAQLQDKAKNGFAQDLRNYMSTNGLDYDTLKSETPDQIKAIVDQIPSVRDLKSQLGDDPSATDVVDQAVVSMIMTTQKAELDLISNNANDISANKAQIVALGKSVTDYQSSVSASMASFQGQLQDAQQSAQDARQSVEDLQGQTKDNTIQLNAVQDVLFSQSSPADKLTLLNSGYKADDLSDEERQELIDETEADAKRQQVSDTMVTVVTSFQQIDSIAKNLGIQSPELDQAAQLAGTVTSVASDVMDGNYLGALTGITGLFGSPEAQFQTQIMGYLNQSFQQVNQRLDDIVDGQRQLMAGLVSVSDQLSAYDKSTQEHLSEIDQRLDDLQDMARQEFYLPLASCASVETNVQQVLKSNGIVRVNLRSFDQMAYLVTPAGQTFQTIHSCIDFLDYVYQQTSNLNPSPFSFNPLALQYGTLHAPVLVVDPSLVHDFSTQTQQFIEGQYKPTITFFLKELAKPSPNFAITQSIDEANALAMASVPTRNVQSLRIKMSLYSKGTPSCAKATALSNPLINMLCQDSGSNPDFTDLSDTPSAALEKQAESRADALLSAPIFFDSLEQLSLWSEFYAPVSDYADEAHQIFFTTAKDFLAQQIIQPKGLRLLKGALRVDSIGIAQMNILYGDVLAAQVFNELWNDQGGLPSTADALTGDQITAAALLKSGNSFLQQNVAMLALDKARFAKSQGWDYSYAFGLQYMQMAVGPPDVQLSSLFSGKIQFKNIWTAIDPNDQQGDATCASMADGPEKPKHCRKVPAMAIAGVDVPLPTVDQFTSRAFVYPDGLNRLIRRRDEVASLAAEYQTFNYATVGSADIKAKTARTTELETSLVNVLQ